MSELVKKLIWIQNRLKAPKSQYNSFSNFYYRSAEDILEALKPLLAEQELTLFINDEIIQIGERYYIKAVCTLTDGKENIETQAFAREAENKKGSDESQITGACSSYARKYALNGMFCIDDAKDPDSEDNRETKKTQSVKREFSKKTETKKEESKTEEFISEDTDIILGLDEIQTLKGLTGYFNTYQSKVKDKSAFIKAVNARRTLIQENNK